MRWAPGNSGRRSRRSKRTQRRGKEEPMRLSMRGTVPVLCLIAVLMTAPLWAAEEGTTAESATDLAKKTQNPVADLISVPFQNNFNLSAGPNDATIYNLNFQPVIPIHLTEDWNLITRTILPVINQPS